MVKYAVHGSIGGVWIGKYGVLGYVRGAWLNRPPSGHWGGAWLNEWCTTGLPHLEAGSHTPRDRRIAPPTSRTRPTNIFFQWLSPLHHPHHRSLTS